MTADQVSASAVGWIRTIDRVIERIRADVEPEDVHHLQWLRNDVARFLDPARAAGDAAPAAAMDREAFVQEMVRRSVASQADIRGLLTIVDQSLIAAPAAQQEWGVRERGGMVTVEGTSAIDHGRAVDRTRPGLRRVLLVRHVTPWAEATR